MRIEFPQIFFTSECRYFFQMFLFHGRFSGNHSIIGKF